MNDRSKTIGSSEIAAIMGLNKYMTPIDVWKRKTSRAEEFEGNAATKRGLLLEPVVAEWFTQQTGIEVELAQEPIKLDDYPCSATPDYLYNIDDKARGILEIKTTRFRVNADDIPQSWFLQAQYQAAVINRYFIWKPVKEISLAWLDGDLAFGYTTFDVDDEYGQRLLNFAYDWWQRHIVQDVMPDPSNAKEAAYKWPQHLANKIEASDNLQSLVKSAKDLKLQISELENDLEEKTLLIKSIMQDAEAVVSGEDLLCTWKTSKGREKFDEKTFKAENEELYQKFCKPVPGNRVFLLK